MIDDREEFADPRETIQKQMKYTAEIFMMLKIFCQNRTMHFMWLSRRGHANDRLCTEMVLRRSYLYLGMIGSKGKVAKTFEIMKEEGYSEEQINTIHAPIGLKIGARTPEEIAISIAAQMIADQKSRNRKYDE